MALSKETMSKCSGHMSAYKSACEDHPYLKSFDASLQQKTIKVIDSLTAGPDDGLLSQHAVHKEVTDHLLQVSQDVANFIFESKDDVWENKALRALVTAYFENTMKTLEIFDNVMECVVKAKRGQLYIQEAVAQFDKESAEKDVGGKKKRYEKTLKDLKRFEAIGDPFDGQGFKTQFELIKEQQESLLKELCVAKEKLDEELREAKKKLEEEQQTSLIWNVVFGAAIALAAIASIAVMAVAVGVAAPFVALAVPFLALGWVGVNFYMEKKMEGQKKREEDVNKQIGVASLADKATETNKEAMKSVSVLVHELRVKISDILKLVTEAVEDEEEEDDELEMKGHLHLIGEEVRKLTEKIKQVGETVSTHSEMIMETRRHVLEKINGSGKYHDG
ncbi:PREDICTED: UPF0496 protein At3g28270-like [Camelina sativa]|uniref:UPF0496 protein At3g28270-like n=1 Tax=Camelina sativa TaxID=90675 RepID=A0ABM0TN89_CAMSA|nr:PREDICTED: UPF0496 protein At3g28270-like [Camelina sativa]